MIEELGTYDPLVPETDARALLKADRVAYWVGVGAQPSEKVAVLIKKYGEGGTHVDQQKAALEKLSRPKSVPEAGPAVISAKQKREEAAAAEAAKQAAEKAAAAEAAQQAADAEAAAAPADQAAADAPPETTES